MGVIGEKQNGWLEIDPQLEPILPEVLMTFLWAERRRKEGGERLGEFRAGSKSSSPRPAPEP